MPDPLNQPEVSAVSLTDPVLPVDPERLARQLGQALAGLHGADPTPLPELDLVVAAQQVAAEIPDDDHTEVADGPFQGQPRSRLLAAARAAIDGLPDRELALVPIRFPSHLGSCRLFPDGAVVLDPPSHAGDRHLELAALAVGLADRFGPAVVVPFIDAYGMNQVEPRRLDAAQLLLAVRPSGPPGSAAGK